MGLVIGGLVVMAFWRPARKKTAREKPTPETDEERRKREREDERERRRLSDIAKFLADPRFLK